MWVINNFESKLQKNAEESYLEDFGVWGVNIIKSSISVCTGKHRQLENVLSWV